MILTLADLLPIKASATFRQYQEQETDRKTSRACQSVAEPKLPA